MKTSSFLRAAVALPALCSWLAAAQPAQAQSSSLTLEDISNWHYIPESYSVHSSTEGDNYARLSADLKRIELFSFRDGSQTGVLFDADKARGKAGLKQTEGFTLSPDRRKILLMTQRKAIYRRSFSAVYYIYDTQNNSYEPLSDGGPQQQPIFSPDGTMVAFVREGDLFVVKLLYGNAESRVTKDGEFNKLINGLPDWVNEEEFSTARSFDFSADSEMLAWVRYDESRVPLYSMTMYKGDQPVHEDCDNYPGAYRYKYPVAGEVNSSVSVMTFDIKNRVTRTLKLPLDSDAYVPRIHFTSDPARLAVVTLNRRQNRMDIYMANPRSTECTLAVREENEKYIPETTYGSLRFFGDRFAFISDRSGFKHIYLYNLSGKLERQLTKGDFDVAAFYDYDPATGRCFYAAHDESPLRTSICISEKNGKVRRLTSTPGTHSAIFSKDKKYLLQTYSSLQQPPVVSLCRTSDGRSE